MSEFELLAIPISLILGLGITQILGGVTTAIRQREHVALHWLPFSWAFLIFLFQVQYFFVIWDINQEGRAWTWDLYGPALFHAVVLFLAAGLILPANRALTTDLLSDFDKHGRLALVLLATALIVAIPLNVYHGSSGWISQANAFDAILTLLIAAVFSRRRSWQSAATILFGLAQIYAMIAVWSRPGEY